jgi:hypothetical protein
MIVVISKIYFNIFLQQHEQMFLRCRCGRYRREHIRNVKAFHNSYQDELLTENENWSIEKNTKEYPTDAFGILNFQGVDTYCKKSKVYQSFTLQN